VAERYSHLLGPSGPLAKTHTTAGKLLPGNFVVASLGDFQGEVE